VLHPTSRLPSVQNPTPHCSPALLKAGRLADPVCTDASPCSLSLLARKERRACPASSSSLLHNQEEQLYRRKMED